MSIATISPQQLHDQQSSGQAIDLIDVRTPIEFQEVHVPFARNVPLDQLDPTRVAEERHGTESPLYVICRSGNRAQQACAKFVAAGHANVVNVAGGTLAWDQAGLPVVRGAKMISLERQVRIAAGSLVLIGAALGFFVNIYWIALSAFVGAGLIFAGVTDTCGMGLMLARMPWNQVKTPATADSSASNTCSVK
jgi:rhodanese-related sulfurtransferase